jgi:hypothetical protein
MDATGSLRLLQREAAAYTLLGPHPRIARYVGVCVCPPDIALVLAWYGRGTAREALDVAIAATWAERESNASTGAVVGPAPISGQAFTPVRYIRLDAPVNQRRRDWDTAQGWRGAAISGPLLPEEAATEALAPESGHMQELRSVAKVVEATIIAARKSSGFAGGAARPAVEAEDSSPCALLRLPNASVSWIDDFDVWLASHAVAADEANVVSGPCDVNDGVGALWIEVTRRLGFIAPAGLAPSTPGMNAPRIRHASSAASASMPTMPILYELDGVEVDPDELGVGIERPLLSPVTAARSPPLLSPPVRRKPVSRSSSTNDATPAATTPLPPPTAAPFLADAALHLQLMRDIPFLGGAPQDVVACPYWAPQLWPTADIGAFADCWQRSVEAGALGDGGGSHRPRPAVWTAHRRGHSQGSHGSASDSSGLAGWVARLRIASDIAEALAHMHHGISPPVMHLDVKSGAGARDRARDGHRRIVFAPCGGVQTTSGLTTLVAGCLGTLARRGSCHARIRMMMATRRPGLGTRLQ